MYSSKDFISFTWIQKINIGAVLKILCESTLQHTQLWIKVVNNKNDGAVENKNALEFVPGTNGC